MYSAQKKGMTMLTQHNLPLLIGIAAIQACVVPGIVFAPTPAAAQFVCGGSLDGSEPQTASGSTATGLGTACGRNVHATGTASNAMGGGFFTTNATSPGALAIGNNTNAGGTPISIIQSIGGAGAQVPVAIGVNAIATGDFAIAVGSSLGTTTAATGANSSAFGSGASAGG